MNRSVNAADFHQLGILYIQGIANYK
jgi:hypothetical protein